MEIGYKENIRQEIYNEFLKFDVTIDTSKSFKETLLDYSNWRRRFIKKVPREVCFSKEIKTNSNFMSYKKAISKIEYKFKNGQDLTPFLSKLVVNTPLKANSKSSSSDKDVFLNAFNIHHLHLNTEYQRKPTKGITFIKRSNYLLFVMIKQDKVYFLDIEKHNFGNINLFRIIKNNWEHLIQPYKVKGFPPLSQNYRSDEEISKLLKAGVSPSVQIDGSFYALGLLTTSGHSMDWSRHLESILQAIDSLYEELLLNQHEIEQKLNISIPTYKISLNSGDFFVQEENSGFYIIRDRNNILNFIEEKRLFLSFNF